MTGRVEDAGDHEIRGVRLRSWAMKFIRATEAASRTRNPQGLYSRRATSEVQIGEEKLSIEWSMEKTMQNVIDEGGDRR